MGLKLERLEMSHCMHWIRFLVHENGAPAPKAVPCFNIVKAMDSPYHEIRHIFAACWYEAFRAEQSVPSIEEAVKEYKRCFPNAAGQSPRDHAHVWEPPVCVSLDRLEMARAMTTAYGGSRAILNLGRNEVKHDESRPEPRPQAEPEPEKPEEPLPTRCTSVEECDTIRNRKRKDECKKVSSARTALIRHKAATRRRSLRLQNLEPQQEREAFGRGPNFH